ncbi:alpha/beta fold hydrolase [Chitinophaga horti]|uniref:Alpha/beta fold hydrolase n=1 Tax=Chitinophaga horti TaxID=2920382 RepID=A0ABY6J6J1_9BACT|nr:alpha/beta fold hydrolase [Chitinophaga horti]UYQ94222.1 alpha/beta fold hydrolase [Chitinophaga horti]
MRLTRFVLILAALLGSISVNAQQRNIAGDWYGVFMKARAVLTLTDNNGTLQGVFKSPDQTQREFPMDVLRQNGDTLEFEIRSLALRYKGLWLDSAAIYKGHFSQAGQQFQLDFSRNKLEKAVVNFPQEPKPPFDYEVENITFNNTKDNVTLAGTFTRPRGTGKVPAVLLITGSGAQDRNEELFGHKPFWVIADYFTRNGIAVLRYDDRGFGKSTGNYGKADVNDFARDAAAGVAWLQQRADVDAAKVGVLGHSEGGMVVQMLAANDKSIGFIVSMAGPGLNGVDMARLQNAAVNRSGGMPDSVIKVITAENTRLLRMLAAEKNIDTLRRKLVPLVNNLYDAMPELYRKGLQKPAFTFQTITSTTSPAMLSIVRFDPALYMPKIKCPVLAINGEKDIQVSAKENIEGWSSGLKKAGNKDVTVHIFPGLNHLFQQCKTCDVQEYAMLEQTISPEVLEMMTKWIQQRTGPQK